MVSFQRMKDELDGLSNQVSTKIPVVGKTGCLTVILIVVSIVVILGLAIGLGVQRTVSAGGSASSLTEAIPSYIFVSAGSESCPPLEADRLLTTTKAGESFEGLVVNLACRGDYNPFPNQVKCRRKHGGGADAPLEWSHLPVCYPTVLVSKAHWSKTLHARSVSCTGNATATECRMSCIRDYIAVEKNPYVCRQAPCAAWDLGESTCYMCDQNCTKLHDIGDPQPSTLLASLGCKSDCYQIVVNSDDRAAIWQNKRTGLFEFVGEHNGKPVYQNDATKEFLFYTFTGSEWLVGPDFRKPHAGIQVFGNDDTTCPERIGGKNVSRLYIDSSEPSPGGTGKWTKDDSLSFECYNVASYKSVTCPCKTYKVFNTVYADGKAPDAVTYLTGTFEKSNETEASDILAPLYFDKTKQLYLFSHHPRGKVWQVSTKLSTTPLRGVHPGGEAACPDNEAIAWEWFNTTTIEGQQLYVKDSNIHVKCIDNFS